MPIDWDTVPDTATRRRGAHRAHARAVPAAAQPHWRRRASDPRRARPRVAPRDRRDALGHAGLRLGRAARVERSAAAGSKGRTEQRVVDAADSPLHVLGYSTPVDAVVSLEELREHVFTHRDDPDLVPYRTSYWEEQWGFCMSSRQLEALPEGDYHVVVDATLEDRLADLGRGRDPRARPTTSSCSARTSATRRSQTTTSRASSSSGPSARALAAAAVSGTPTACSGAPGRWARSAGSPGTARRSTASDTVSSSRASATRAAPVQAQPSR